MSELRNHKEVGNVSRTTIVRGVPEEILKSSPLALEKALEQQLKGSGPVKVHKPIPMFFPSHDGRSMHGTIQTLNLVSVILQRPLLTTTCQGIGQAVAMNGMLRSFDASVRRMGIEDALVERRNGLRVTRALWVEDDIEFVHSQAGEIARMITEADKHNWNMVVPYSTGFRDSGEYNWVYFKKPDKKKGIIGRPFTEPEIQSLRPFDRINGLGGLGFYYGDLFLDYVWYEGTFNGRDRFGLPSYSGIDWNYFLDNDIDLRHYPITILHEKPVKFSNSRVIRYWGDGNEWAETQKSDALVGVITTRAQKKRAAARKRAHIVS